MGKPAKVKIRNKYVGEGEAIYIIAEIGINHNGSVETTKKMIDGAVFSGCDAVKFQKRTPELCVPKDQWYIERDTPWGRMAYIDYRHKMEFDKEQYAEINNYCNEKKIDWFASCWDEESVDFIEQFDPPVYKAASASLTDMGLLVKMQSTGKPLIISTGMSTLDEIMSTAKELNCAQLLIAHSTSTYPCPPNELNLKMINTLKKLFPNIPIGYSGHETGLAPTWAAVAMGAAFIERHITLDRAMWGSDQAASVEIMGLYRLVSNIRDIEKSFGDGIKKIYVSELSSRKKLRRINSHLNVTQVV